MIQGPRREFVMIIAKRIVADQNTTNAILAIGKLNQQVRSLELDLSALSASHQSILTTKSEQADLIGQLREDVDDWKTLAHANKAWAQVGKVGTITVVVTGIVVGVIVLKREFDQ